MVKNIEMVRGDTLPFGVEFEGLDQDLDAAYFTVRNRNNDEQILQKSIGDGITKTEANKYRVRVAPGTSPTTGAQVVYELATPLTYQLTPQEVETLKGQNHVWSDAGDVDLTYVADTKLYIDNKIAQAIAAALNA